MPRNQLTSIEVQMAAPLVPRAEALALRGRLLRVIAGRVFEASVE
ncbi:hypothetical protein PQR05_27380 [Paraburkholderia sediminicola]